jgi:kinesin family protein 2/24
MNICVCVRKRPLFEKEEKVLGEIDCVSSNNPRVVVHECKYKVDGITKYIDNSEFIFDNAFNEKEDSFAVYQYSIQPLIPLLFKGGVVTCFAYGQTGSGKTFTVEANTKSAIKELW